MKSIKWTQMKIGKTHKFKSVNSYRTALNE